LTAADVDSIAGPEPRSPAPAPLGPGPTRLSSRLVAASGRYVLIWLSVAVIGAADHPLDAGGVVAVSLAAALWLGTLRAAFASVPYALGPGVPALIGTATGLVGVAAINGHVAGLQLSLPALLGAAFGVLVSITVWECVLERTLSRRRVLVIGSTDIAEVAVAAQRGRRMAFEVLGAETGVALSRPALDALAEVVTVQRPDLIVLADDQSSSAVLHRLLDIADGRFRVAGLTSFYEYALGCVPLHQITPMWFMSLLHVRQRSYARGVKRAFDLMTAGLALLLTAPLLPLIALAVRGTPGPIIYRQIRVGDRGRRFKIYKFRTMVDGAERPGEAVWAKDADPRTTPVGAFLRRTHLDELPQLFNVLKGDMSMVGPRPERPELIAMLEESIPFWSRRLLIKPGMTGWAQVHCGYAADFTAAHEKLAYDFWYLRHRSLAVDLAICVRTLRILLDLLEPGRVALRRLRASRHHAAP
jgi:exopolysaccharide biosynthesis polyprenyl glycosylphosphotransferase